MGRAWEVVMQRRHEGLGGPGRKRWLTTCPSQQANVTRRPGKEASMAKKSAHCYS